MLGNNIGPVINYKLKILPLPFLVETAESSPSNRIFKFDCAIPGTTIKYEITNYVCPFDIKTEPTTVYTTNQTFTADRPKKIKAIATKDGYKTSKIFSTELSIKPSLTDINLRSSFANYYKLNNLTGINILPTLTIDVSNYNYYQACNDTTTVGSITAFYKLYNSTLAADKWTQSATPDSNTASPTVFTFVPTPGANRIPLTFYTPLCVKVGFPKNPAAGYLEGSESTFYVKPYYPRPTITQSFSGRPAVVTIKKEYESITSTESITKGLIDASKATGKIYYTLDGTRPTKNSNLYTEPFTVNKDTIVKALVLDDLRDGTLAAAYINVGQIQYVNLAKATYTTGNNVSAITVLKVDGGKGTLYACSGRPSTVTIYLTRMGANIPNYNTADYTDKYCGTNSTPIKELGFAGECFISKYEINSTSTFYITAGKDATAGTNSSGTSIINSDVKKSYIQDSNKINLTGNIFTGNMDNIYVTNFMLTSMKLHQAITEPWNHKIGIEKTENMFNYDLDITLNSPILINKVFTHWNIGNTLFSNVANYNGPLLKDCGVYIIEHYRD